MSNAARRGLRWARVGETPIIAPFPGAKHSAADRGAVPTDAVTGADVVLMGELARVYFGGVAAGVEQLYHVSEPVDRLVSGAPLDDPTAVSRIVAPGPGAFDHKHVFDPTVFFFRGEYRLLYSGIGAGEDVIGQARSPDGVRFIKEPHPVMPGRAPAAVVHNDRVYVFFVQKSSSGRYSIHLARSDDGTTFAPVSAEPVVQAGNGDEWDGLEVTTPRIFAHGGVFYMLYAGGGKEDPADAPRAFGLARSSDLVHWRKYPGNPVFECSHPGGWDDGAMWFGTVFRVEKHLYMLYEGASAPEEGSEPSTTTRVGLARVAVQEFEAAVEQWSGDDG